MRVHAQYANAIISLSASAAIPLRLALCSATMISISAACGSSANPRGGKHNDVVMQRRRAGASAVGSGTVVILKEVDVAHLQRRKCKFQEKHVR